MVGSDDHRKNDEKPSRGVCHAEKADKELVFAGEGLFAITETLDPAKLQFSYDDFEFVENLYSSVFVLSADSSLNLKDLDDLEAYVKAGNPVSVAVNGATGSEAFLAAALFGSMGAGYQYQDGVFGNVVKSDYRRFTFLNEII